MTEQVYRIAAKTELLEGWQEARDDSDPGTRSSDFQGPCLAGSHVLVRPEIGKAASLAYCADVFPAIRLERSLAVWNVTMGENAGWDLSSLPSKWAATGKSHSAQGAL